MMKMMIGLWVVEGTGDAPCCRIQLLRTQGFPCRGCWPVWFPPGAWAGGKLWLIREYREWKPSMSAVLGRICGAEDRL